MNKTTDEEDVAPEAPSTIGDTKVLLEEFIKKLRTVDSELELLKDDRKQLFEDYARKIDMKTLKAALQVNKIKEKVSHKDTFDMYVDVLEQVA